MITVQSAFEGDMISMDMPPQVSPSTYDASPETAGRRYSGPPINIPESPPPEVTATSGRRPALLWDFVASPIIAYWPRGEGRQIRVTVRCRLGRTKFENCRPHASEFASRIFYTETAEAVESSIFRPVADTRLMGADFLVTTTVTRIGR